MTEYVDEITPTSTGRYLVTTQGSTHLWDMDEGYYIRNPDRVGESLDELLRGIPAGFNGSKHALDGVVKWPVVGDFFYVQLPPPAYFHRSSYAKSIEKLS